MFGRRIKLFRLLGFDVWIDLTWLILGVLIAWSLAAGLFPALIPGLTTVQYWAMALFGVAGLLLSIVLHEFSHSLVARRFGMPIGGITLFIFGGIAEMEDEPPKAKAEFVMAIAGPIASLVLAFLFYQLYGARAALGLSAPVSAVLLYLSLLNGILAIFNLLPAFPLDGGRVLRAILWGVRKDIHWATFIASRIGAGFGWALVIAGGWFFIQGNLIGGMWWVLIGLFLRGAALGSYRQLMLQRRLQGTRVGEIMNPHPVSVPASTPLDRLLNHYVAGYHQRQFPVVDGDLLVGCIDADQARRFPRDEWSRHEVRELATGCPEDGTLTPDADASRAVSALSRRRSGLLLVVEHGALMGTPSVADLARRLSSPLSGGTGSREWRA
jgi:Zn-dependent protease